MSNIRAKFMKSLLGNVLIKNAMNQCVLTSIFDVIYDFKPHTDSILQNLFLSYFC